MATYLVRCVEIGREQQAERGKLRRHLAAMIGERLPGASITLAPGRLIVEAGPDLGDVIAVLPGVASVSPCLRVARDDLTAAVVEAARRRLSPGARFAVSVRRAGGGRHPVAGERSVDVARALGDAVAAATGAPIDLTRPDVVLGVELRGDEAFVFDRVIAGVDRTGPPAPRGPGAPRFLADQMLGRLAAWLRMVGYDTVTVYDLADSELVQLAAAEGRILLTRDGALASTRAVQVMRVAAVTPRAQLAEVLGALSLEVDPARFFSRCTRCNALVEPVAEAAVHDRLPPGVRDRGLAFVRCPACAQIYWRGSHVERFLAELAAEGLVAATPARR